VGWVIIPVWVLVSGFGAFILAVRELRSASSATRSTNPSNLVAVNEAAA